MTYPDVHVVMHNLNITEAGIYALDSFYSVTEKEPQRL